MRAGSGSVQYRWTQQVEIGDFGGSRVVVMLLLKMMQVCRRVMLLVRW